MKNSGKSEEVVCQILVLSQSGWQFILGRDEKMQPRFVDFANFGQGFGFASRETISEAREFSKTLQVGFRQGCDTGVDLCMHHNTMNFF